MQYKRFNTGQNRMNKGDIMLEVSNEVLQDSIITLQDRLFEIERNNRIHNITDVSGNNLRTMLQVLRNELLSRNTYKL